MRRIWLLLILVLQIAPIPASANGVFRGRVPVGRQPVNVTVNSQTGRAYVANVESSSVTVVDVATGRIVDSAHPGAVGQRDVAVDEGLNRYYIADGGTGTMVAYNGINDHRLGNTWPAVGSHPYGMAADPILHRVYMAMVGSGELLVFDGVGISLLAQIPLAYGVFDVAVDPSRRKVFVSNAVQNTVTIIDADSLDVLDTVALGGAHNIAVDPKEE